MLAVVPSPHGSVTALVGAATLSQALLIQPGRALEAEFQVKSSFREFLQLHMQLRVAPKSSIPTCLTKPAASVGKAMIRRRSVVGEVGRASRWESRVPTSPQVAVPTASWA